jgi:hypothetical protein
MAKSGVWLSILLLCVAIPVQDVWLRARTITSPPRNARMQHGRGGLSIATASGQHDLIDRFAPNVFQTDPSTF